MHQNTLLGPISDRYGTETKCKASFSTSNITELSGGLMQELEIGEIDAHKARLGFESWSQTANHVFHRGWNIKSAVFVFLQTLCII